MNRHKSTPAHHKDAGYVAFLIHRISGLVLAVFLPLHLYTLGAAIDGADAMQTLLSVTDNAFFKLIETGLVSAFVVHFVGGMRLLLLDVMGWQRTTLNWLSTTVAAGVIAGVVFLLSAAGGS